MEWVETTAKTLEEAKDLALDRLGVAADEAEFEVLEEPRPGLFGRLRGEARVRARVMPTAVRPKQDRRGRGRKERDGRGKGRGRQRDDERSSDTTDRETGSSQDTTPDDAAAESADATGEPARGRSKPTRSKSKQSSTKQKEQQVSTQDEESQVPPTEVAAAAETFMSELASAFGVTAETTVDVDGSEIDVRVSGAELGLMVGHGGRTLLAVQDLARVASQRRLGDHETRLRIDIGGYREKRNEALSRFAMAVANEVVESGAAKALEPMQSADRKVVHDALASVEGVTSRSEGDDPARRVIISPA